MQAIVQSEYGSPDVLSLAEVDMPMVKSNEVLVKVRAAAVHAGDWHLMRGEPFLIRLIFGGLLKPKIRTLGTDMAGCVESVGAKVTQFKPGDEVFGELSEFGFGTFAEYVSVPEKALALKPVNLTFEQAAAVPVSGLSALQALRNVGQIQPGQRVLVNGAAGGVGSFAVQLAKAFGAEVTGVCSTKKVDMVRSLGADHILDYSQKDITQMTERYDLVLDTAAYRSVFDLLPLLTSEGTYVIIGGSTVRLLQVMLFGPLISKIHQRKVKCLAQKPNQADLIFLRELITEGKLSPFIDRCYSLSEVPAAIRYLEQRQAKGKIAITV
ncbi:MAG: NAD(P)-dependent alcohol dehydrogenase [Phormidesmis sp.]